MVRVLAFTTTIMPAANRSLSSFDKSVKSMRTGMRCWIFTKLPAELSVGTNEYLEPVAPDIEVTLPLNSFIANGIYCDKYFLSDMQVLDLCLLIIGNDPFLGIRKNIGDGLPCRNKLSFL